MKLYGHFSFQIFGGFLSHSCKNWSEEGTIYLRVSDNNRTISLIPLTIWPRITDFEAHPFFFIISLLTKKCLANSAAKYSKMPTIIPTNQIRLIGYKLSSKVAVFVLQLFLCHFQSYFMSKNHLYTKALQIWWITIGQVKEGRPEGMVL